MKEFPRTPLEPPTRIFFPLTRVEPVLVGSVVGRKVTKTFQPRLYVKFLTSPPREFGLHGETVGTRPQTNVNNLRIVQDSTGLQSPPARHGLETSTAKRGLRREALRQAEKEKGFLGS